MGQGGVANWPLGDGEEGEWGFEEGADEAGEPVQIGLVFLR